MNNPLIHAVMARNHALDIESDLMFEIGGEAAFDPFDEQLATDVANLVGNALDAVMQLSPRARQARLNLIWRGFIAEQKRKRGPHEEVSAL